MSGKLLIVGTPIGNLQDLTPRAAEALKEADIIACENRERHFKLLNHLGLKKRVIECSPANEKNSANGIAKLVAEGNTVALVSDAGCPGVSDPGRWAAKAVRDAGLPVSPVPGVSAVTTLLSVCGFSTARVVFLGFLPKSENKQKKELSLYVGLDAVIVLFTAGRDLKKILSAIEQTFGNAEICIGREMTKLHEEYLFGTAGEMLDWEIEEAGEFSLAIDTRQRNEASEEKGDFPKDSVKSFRK